MNKLMKKRKNTLIEQKQLEVIDQYKQEIPIKKICQNFNISPAYIQTIRKKHGVQSDYTLSRRQNMRKFTVNQKFFEQIDNEEKAYFLGLLMADGWVQGNLLGISLKDIELVELFKKTIESNHITKPRKNCNGVPNQLQLLIGSKKIVQDLAILGLIPNKYKRTRISEKIPTDMIRHFIRGYFDGDGSIYINSRRNAAQICSCSYEILQQIENILKNFNIIRKEKKYINSIKNYHNFVINDRNEVMKFFDYCYNNASIFLQRKYNKFIEIKNRKAIKTGKNKYFGVYQQTSGNYYAKLKHNKILYHLGTFVTEKEAAEAYNKKSKELNLSDFQLNNF